MGQSSCIQADYYGRGPSTSVQRLSVPRISSLVPLRKAEIFGDFCRSSTIIIILYIQREVEVSGEVWRTSTEMLCPYAQLNPYTRRIQPERWGSSQIIQHKCTAFELLWRSLIDFQVSSLHFKQHWG